VEIAHFTEASSGRAVRRVSGRGSVTTGRDARRIAEIREASPGACFRRACATAGGIQALRNFADVAEFTSVVYARPQCISYWRPRCRWPHLPALTAQLRRHGMTDKQLRDETITLFLAGHETTASTLSWTWWLLAQNPAVEKKLHAELDFVLAGRPPSFDDLPKLAYTGHVITESLRLYPAAWGMARLVVEDHEVAGYPVTKGMGVAMAQWVVHRDPRWYDAPEKFQPERWEGDLLKRLPRFAYFPFGGGPRQCIGNSFALMEAALILAKVAQKFRLRLVANHPVVPLASITLRPRHGVLVLLESRHQGGFRDDSISAQTAVAD